MIVLIFELVERCAFLLLCDKEKSFGFPLNFIKISSWKKNNVWSFDDLIYIEYDSNFFTTLSSMKIYFASSSRNLDFLLIFLHDFTWMKY